MNERDIIKLLGGMSGDGSGKLVRGIGDDCAVIEKNPEISWLVTMDTLVETVHFDTGWHPPEKIGRKAVAVNVSDIAAMGGKPQFVFLSLALPAGFEEQWIHEFLMGVTAACRHYSCLLSGGDTVKSADSIVVTIAVIGEVESARVLYRNTARADDEIWISGYPGQAAAGLELCRSGRKERSRTSFEPLVEAHLNPDARVLLGNLLAESGLVHSMMDVSDGLATDLAHICEQSGTGAVIEEKLLPVSRPLLDAARMLNIAPSQFLLAGGEDYELIFTAPSGSSNRFDSIQKKASLKLTCIGKICTGQGVRLASHVTGKDERRLVDISFSGYDHFRSQ